MPLLPSLRQCLMNIAGSAILSFGLYHVHSLSGVTEGGILGATLLLQHWFQISPAWSGLVMNAACYLLGWKLMGRDFVLYSLVAGGGFSLFYALFERFPPLWPGLAAQPLAAAVLGALFVGVGVGLCVRAGGAPGGDDALAMSISHLTGWNIRWPYLMSDLIVLALSLSYIPLERIGYSLLTVVLSGQLIGLMQRFPGRKADAHSRDTESPRLPLK
ncbi:YitT family protein [Mailhella massiliensis]|uniref:YitT family protein n=1 Tax=Mailhella massiliensis TaxID=1903261 RepID=A0A921AUL5_9BACT|nr:YitT family protein [Mailhella massiliensis]HJD96645.1 YitT family protein [Mailhella massiliensis]